MKKLLILIALFSLLIPSVAFAATLAPAYSHEISCDLVWVSGTNTSGSPAWGFGHIKAHAEGEFSPIVILPPLQNVAPGGTFTISWEPPDGFVGTVRVFMTFFGSGMGYSREENLECHDYDLVFDQRNECEGNNYYRIMLTDYGQYADTLYHSGFFTWSEPFLLESRTFGPFDLGEFGEHPAVTLDEPEVCQAVHELAFVHTKDCIGWSYGYVLDGVETIIDSGEWNNLLEQEKIFVSFEVFLPEGEIATRTPIFGPWYLVEPADCHDITIKSHQAADCDGYARAVNLYDLGVYQGHLLFESGVFTDPYALEPGLPAVSFAIPSEYGGGTVDFDALSEPADCHILQTYKAHQAYLKDNCEGIQRVINLYEGPASDPYDVLVGTLYNEIVPFVDPLILETIPAVTVDVPAAHGPDYTFAAMVEPEFCYSTCASDVFSRSWTEEILTPEGAVQVTTFFEYVDSLDPETVCRITEEVEIVYESCLNAESTYEVPGVWTDWFTVNGPNKERSRTVEVFDGETDFKCGEYTEYDQECFADDFVWVWRGCGCSIRDRTYELYHFGSPPLTAQRAYCGCDFSCMDEGAWNDSGYVNNCQGEDYTFWDELPKWCGFTSCE
jgi:hypothetical protein